MCQCVTHHMSMSNLMWIPCVIVDVVHIYIYKNKKIKSPYVIRKQLKPHFV